MFGASAGKFAGGSNRLLVAQRFICQENASVLPATILCYFLLGKGLSAAEEDIDHQRTFYGVSTDVLSLVLLVGVHFLGALAAILDSGFLVAVERDWIIVMSEAHPTRYGSTNEEKSKVQQNWLTDTNVMMTQIDLTCKVMAPAAAGFFVAFWDDTIGDNNHGPDLRGAAILSGGLNCIALVVEYVCTLRIYRDVPGLSIKSPAAAIDLEESSRRGHGCATSTTFSSGLRIYLEQRISFAGLALALL